MSKKSCDYGLSTGAPMVTSNNDFSKIFIRVQFLWTLLILDYFWILEYVKSDDKIIMN